MTMPFTTAEKFKGVLTALSVLRYVLKSSGKTGTTDAYRHAERFFQTVLNRVYELNLENLNELQSNYPAIDLGDKARRTCFQVTGENSSTKINQTITKFFHHGLDKDYDRLRFLILTTKKSYKRKFTVPTGFDFDIGRDIPDVDDLLKSVEGSSDEDIASIHAYVESELAGIVKHFAPAKSLLANVEPRMSRPPANCRRVAECLDIADGDLPALQESLTWGYGRLAALSKNLREYLFVILTRGEVERPVGSDRVSISPVTLEGILSIDHVRHLDLYRAAARSDLVDMLEDPANPTLYLSWEFSIYGDFFVLFREMFASDEEDLRRLIVDGDFRLIDK